MNKRVENFLMTSKTPSIIIYSIDGIILKIGYNQVNLTEAYKIEENRDGIEDMLSDLIDSDEIDYKNKMNLKGVIRDLRIMAKFRKNN